MSKAKPSQLQTLLDEARENRADGVATLEEIYDVLPNALCVALYASLKGFDYQANRDSLRASGCRSLAAMIDSLDYHKPKGEAA